MKFIVILPCLIFSGLLLFSQKNTPIQSADVIKTASQLYDSGEYKKSIQLYEQIDQNDSNYVKSLYGIALNCEADSQYSKGILVCEKALQLKEQRDIEADIYNTFGNILNHAGQKEKSLLIFNEAIKKYPTYPFLYFNKGVLLFEQNNFSEATTIFKQTLLVNPYQYSAHFYLGLCAIHEGKIVPAFLSFVGYLLVNPDGKYNKRCINILASIASGKDEILEYKSKRKEEPEDNYLMTEDILLSKIALDKEYKIKVSLDDPIFRQIQVVFEKLEYKEDDTDFWMQYYVPYYKKLFNEEQFEPFIFWSFENVQIKEIQDYNKKNKKLIDNFTTETANYFNKIRSTETLDYNKRLVQKNNYYYSNGILQGKGELTDDEKNFQGAWTFFYPQGNIKCKGQYGAGVREGNWTFYFFSGNLQAHENYKNGKLEGRQQYYSEKGLLTQDDIYSNNQPNGTQIAYWANGRVYSTSSYIAGKQAGEYREFSSGGKQIAVKNYVNDVLSGPFKTYYPDGQLKESGNYIRGNLDGPYKDYHENGQISSEGLFKNGANDGEWKTYYDNGIMKSKSYFTNLKQEGIEEEFYENGALKSTYVYKKGNLDGEAFNYDLNHKPYVKFMYSKNKLESAVYFDSLGKISSSYERKNNLLELDIFDAERTKIVHRSFDENGALNGKETYYYPSGKIREVNHYINGEETGVSSEYYPNGKPKSEIDMNNGKMDGHYITYYQSGGMESEGWTRDGQIIGYWNYYNEVGNLSSINYYDNSVLNGYKTEYYGNGAKFIEKKFYKGLLESLKQFDSTGKLLVYDTFPQFSGKFLLVYPNGNKMQEGNYTNGAFDGSVTQFYFDGSVEFSQYYKNGLLDSDYVAYDYHNVKEAEGHYKAGKKSGLWKSYYENGQLEWVATYAFDDLQGPRRFFDYNNKMIAEINYDHDERDSIAFKIDPDGKLLYSIRYDKGTVKGYTYQGKDGKPISEIKTENGLLSVKSFFQNGNPSRRCQFIDNSLNGTDLIYHSNGNIYLQDSLVFGISEGQFKEYDFKGNLVKLSNYKNDRLHGKYLEYNSHGVLIRDLNYYNNNKHGESKYYSDNGSLVETRYYFYGILLGVKK